LQNTLAKHTGYEVDDAKFVEYHRLLRVNEITADEFFEAMNTHYPGKKPLTSQNYMDDKTFLTRAEEVYKLADELKKQGIGVGILSNVYQFSADVLKERGYYEGFDPIILSCEVGAAKPDPVIYTLAEQKAGAKGSQIIFVDDQPKCMPVPETMGWHTVLATSPEQIVREVKSIIAAENS
jgi:HAD superfamily hydrolase (TIGR01509 family)